MRLTRAILVAPILLLGACSLSAPAEPTAVPTASPKPQATAVPTASSPWAVLVVPADMDKALSDAYQATVYSLAEGSGLRFQVRNSFSTGDLDPALKILIALPPDPGIAALAAAAPKVQFLAINIPGINASGNISTLATDTRPDAVAFIAGYTAAMISNDYRTGMIVPKGDATASVAAAAFANGMAYYCGLCSGFRLYADQTGAGLSFPQFVQIPTDELPSRFGGYVNYLVGSQKADAVYVYPDPKIAVQQLFDALGQTGAQTISVVVPNQKPPGWVMSIHPDEVKAIESAWPGLVAGNGGQAVPSPLGLAQVDPALLSPGRERLVQQVLDDLQAGRITTGVGQ